jgi:hypothetical protein
VTRRRETKSGLLRLLEHLGSDVESVIANLERSGIHGIPSNAEGCVLARYLHAVVGGESFVISIQVRKRSVRILWRSIWAQPLVVSLPLTLCEFIERFDRGEVPQLVSPETRLQPNLAPTQAPGSWAHAVAAPF